MSIYVLIAVIFTAAMGALYYWRLRQDTKEGIGMNKLPVKKLTNIFILMGCGLILKLIICTFYQGYSADISCFSSWADSVFTNGFGKFYTASGFSDYPPGYMYVLFVIAGLKKLLGVTSLADGAGLALLKSVPVICDVAAAFFVYRIGRRRFSEVSSLVLAAAYMLLPVVILNSSVWGQVDSVYTLCIISMAYLCMEQKRIPAYFVFMLGVLIKPQMLVFTPILLFSFVEQVILTDFSVKKLLTDVVTVFVSVGVLLLTMMPYGLSSVLSQYVKTLGSYEYATVNAYNFWALLGLNWQPQTGKFIFFTYQQWGNAAIVAAVVLGGLVFFKNRGRKENAFLCGAVVMSTFFLFSVRMHERYLFPVVILLLLAYVVAPKKEYFISFLGFALLHFINEADILYIWASENSVQPTDTWMKPTAFLSIVMFVYLIYGCLKKEKSKVVPLKESKPVKGKETNSMPAGKVKIHKSKTVEKLTKFDYIIMLGIMVVYAVVAFVDLGSTNAPEKVYKMETDGNPVVIDLGESKQLSKMVVYLGNLENRKYTLEMSDQRDDGYTQLGTVQATSVLTWNELQLVQQVEGDTTTTPMQYTKAYRYIRLTAQDQQSSIMELALVDTAGKQIQPVNASECKGLFDEQSTFPEEVTYMNGSYFDEIYHARTAYEMNNGLYCYENTHPPLGKELIALGMKMFGTNPFGWRFMGALLGVLMLPFLYLFGKRMTDKTWVASIVTILFAVDFMHFTQTRIATIDVFGTFFIIAMYYFMFRYSQMSFYDTKLSKTFIPLGLCGLSAGLGIASKWTAIYAAAGLAVIFAVIMIQRYREYRYVKSMQNVKKRPEICDVIEHSFNEKFWKTIGFCCIVFVALPILIYILSYIPFNDGYDRAHSSGLLDRLIANQKGMFNYHSTLVATHPFSSWWYEWPTMIRPVYYFSATLKSGLKEGISAFGNPLVWWAGIATSISTVYFIVWDYVKKHKVNTVAIFILFAYMVQYVPWMLVTRITFAYHYFPSVPFVVLTIGYTMYRIVGDKPKRIKYMFLYAAVAVGVFILFYPVISGHAVSDAYVNTWLRWMKDWVLIS